MSKDEALRVLERFVDNALLSSAVSLRILHGKGDGILRKTVKQKLREYGGSIGRMYHPEADGGGDGVTVVELAWVSPTVRWSTTSAARRGPGRPTSRSVWACCWASSAA